MLLFSSVVVVVVVVLSRGAMQTLFSQSSASSLGRTEERERERKLSLHEIMKLELKQQVLNNYCDSYENVA